MTNKIDVITYFVNLKGSLAGQKNTFIINRDLFEYINKVIDNFEGGYYIEIGFL